MFHTRTNNDHLMQNHGHHTWCHSIVDMEACLYISFIEDLGKKKKKKKKVSPKKNFSQIAT